MTRPGRLPAFLKDLTRRKVYRATAVYMATGFVIIEGADLLLPALGLGNPELVYRIIVLVTLIGLPITIVLAWFYDLSPAGLRRDLEDVKAADIADRVMGAAGKRPLVPEINGRPSILVLPFSDLSPEGDLAYLCDGLTDEIITDLSGVQAHVISRTSAMQLKGTSKDVRTLGEELGVQYVLEGAVMGSASNLRINVKLIDSRSDDLLWAEKFQGELGQALEIQERISRTVAEALPLELGKADNERLRRSRIPDPVAYEYFLRAKHEIYKFSAEALDQATGYLERGLEILGENVALLSAMGYVEWQHVNAGIDPNPERLERAAAYAERIEAIEPGSAHAHRLRGLVALLNGAANESIRELEASLVEDPNSSDSLLWLTLLLGLRGRSDDALPYADRILALDPLPAMHQGLHGFLAVMRGDFKNGPGPYGRAHEIEPENPILALGYGQALALAGRTAEAEGIFLHMAEVHPGTFFAGLAVFFRHAIRRERDQALASLTDDVREAGHGDPQYAWTIAEGLTLIGEREEALEFLGSAIDNGMLNYRLLAELDPFLKGLRKTPEFRELMKRVEANLTQVSA